LQGDSNNKNSGCNTDVDLPLNVPMYFTATVRSGQVSSVEVFFQSTGVLHSQCSWTAGTIVPQEDAIVRFALEGPAADVELCDVLMYDTSRVDPPVTPPTPSPTASPEVTASPSQNPSTVASEQPTGLPSDTLSVQPSAGPSDIASASPTISQAPSSALSN